MIQKVLRREDARMFCNFVILESKNLKVKSCTYAVNVFEDIYVFYFHILMVKKYGPSFDLLKKSPNRWVGYYSIMIITKNPFGREW